MAARAQGLGLALAAWLLAGPSITLVMAEAAGAETASDFAAATARGKAAASERDWRRAIEHFAAAQRLELAAPPALFNLALAYDRAGGTELLAIAWYHAYLAAAPAAADAVTVRNNIIALEAKSAGRVQRLIEIASQAATDLEEGFSKDQALADITAARAAIGGRAQAMRSPAGTASVVRTLLQAEAVEAARRVAGRLEAGSWDAFVARWQIKRYLEKRGDDDGAKRERQLAIKAADGIRLAWQRVDAHIEIARWAVEAGNREAAAQRLALAGAFADQIEDPFRRFAALRLVASLQEQGGDLRAAARTLDRIGAAAEKPGKPRWRSLAFASLAAVQAQRGEKEAATGIIGAALEQASQIGEAEQAAQVYAHIAQLLALAGEPQGAENTAALIRDEAVLSEALPYVAWARARAGDEAGAQRAAARIAQPGLRTQALRLIAWQLGDARGRELYGIIAYSLALGRQEIMANPETISRRLQRSLVDAPTFDDFAEGVAKLAWVARLRAETLGALRRRADQGRATAELPAAADLTAEAALWNAVKFSGDPSELRAYLDKYPDGVFWHQARLRLDAVVEAARETARLPDAEARRQAEERRWQALEAELMGDALSRSPHDGQYVGRLTRTWLKEISLNGMCREGDLEIEIRDGRVRGGINVDYLSQRALENARFHVVFEGTLDEKGRTNGVIGRAFAYGLNFTTYHFKGTVTEGTWVDVMKQCRGTYKLTRVGANPVINQLRESGRTRRGWLGVRIQFVTDEIAESLGLPRARGALVASVTEGGPAERAKIEAGDVILSFDGKPIERMRELPRLVADTPPNGEVPVTVWRKGAELTLDVTVAGLEEYEQATRVAKESAESDSDIKALGLTLAPISRELRERFELEESVAGVVVTDVAKDSAAAGKGLRRGDVIVTVSQEKVGTPGDVARKVAKAKEKGRKSVLLSIDRQGDLRFVTLRVDQG